MWLKRLVAGVVVAVVWVVVRGIEALDDHGSGGARQYDAGDRS